MPNQGSKIKHMMWLNGFEKFFKGFLKNLMQYKNKSVFLRNNRFIFALLKGFSKFS